MNKLWQTKLQSSFRDTLTDGAARLKQGWGAAGERPPLAMDTAGSGTAPGKGPQPQYLRLPIDSARKLRWYDREDLSRLIESNLQERQQLAEVNTALREVMLERGMSEEELTTELQSRIEETDRSRFFQEAVHSVLLASAQSEIEHLRQELADSAQQMSQLQSRLAHLETPPEGFKERPTAHKRAARAEVQQPLIARLGLHYQPLVQALRVLQDTQMTRPIPQQSMISVLLIPSKSPHPPNSDLLLQGKLVIPMNPYPSRILKHPQQHHQLKLMAVALKKPYPALQERVEEERQHLLEMSTANAEHAAALESQLQTAEAQLSSTRQTLAESREVAERQLQELRGKLTNCQNQQAEMLRRAQDICLSAEDRAEKAEAKLEKVQAQAARIELELKESRAEAKRLTNELKAREKDLQARDKDCERASGRAVQAEAALAEAKQAGRAEAEKGASVSTLLANARRAADEREAELRKAMREGEAKLQTRNGQLESDIATLRRSVERLEGDVELLEKRATEAESAEAELLQELKQSESVAADRDMLAARAAALEEKVEEGRVERGQVASLRQLAAEAEAARARVEEEVLATARIATGLEARLRTARAEADAAQRDALAANERCSKAEARVDVEVAERLEACGAQRNLWPGPAQEEISRLEVRAQGLQSMLAAVQEDLDDAANLRQQLEVASAGLQARATAAEERVVRLERENRQAADRLHRQVSAAKAEVKEWKREARAAEEERQRWGPKGPPDRHVAPTSPSWAPTSPTTPLPTLNGSARASGRGGGGLHGLAAGGSLGDREAMNGVDMLYLKNVLLKFVEAHALGRLAERDALVPAIATLLRATPAEFRALRVAMSQGNPNWWLSKA
ncbi:hypothetical protein WJX84_009347 [Apatococcus fuscideae]|uniref:GRIP domain-containing protein n=1 Tax=Apatococcus fuscideae TaxID=2026836 RepID=A0AAW1TF64_9CHLO